MPAFRDSWDALKLILFPLIGSDRIFAAFDTLASKVASIMMVPVWAVAVMGAGNMISKITIALTLGELSS